MRHRPPNLLCLLLALGLAGPGFAAEKDKSKKESLREAELGKKEEMKIPERDLAGDITRKRKPKMAERPALEYDQFRLGVEVQVASKRREQIETLTKIIQLGPNPGEAPTLVFRLAELYWEESKFFFFEGNRKDDDIARAKADKNQAALERAAEEKKAAFKESDRYHSLAIDQYRIIVKKYPKYERMDEVLFFLGHNMWEAGQEKEAVTVYSKLLKDFPKSRYQPDAWLAVGQYFFMTSKGKKEEVKRALESFKKAASFTEAKVYGYALYMQGWCYTNLGDHRAAMDLFKSVIYYGELQGKADQRGVSLSREARKDYVVAYSHVGDVMSAKADFQKVGGDENWWGMLKGLANLYYEDGKDKEATILYNLMIRERPLSPDAPFYQGRIVDCVMRVGNKKVTVNQVRELVRIIKEVGKADVLKKDEDKKAFQDAQELAERTLSNLAVNWHNECRKTRDDNVCFLASEVYSDYLEVFSDNPKSYDLRFYFAELLNDQLSKFDRAAEEYTKVVLADIQKVDPQKPKDGSAPPPKEKAGRWLVNAAYNAILAYDEVAKKFEKDEQPPKDSKTKAPIPAPKMNLLASCERYIKYVPQGEKRVEIIYKAGFIYYRYNYFDKAIDHFNVIVNDYTEHELAEVAANLIVDVFNQQGDWLKVNGWARKFYNLPKLGSPKFKEELKKVIEQSSFKLVEDYEGAKDFERAAEAYLTFANEFPKSELADKAWINASVDFFKAGLVGRSIEVRRQLVEKYPKSRFVPQCIYANGEAFEAVADYEQAAENYERYAHTYAKGKTGKGAKAAARTNKGKKGKEAKKDEPPAEGPAYEESKAQVALYNAGVFREGLGHFAAARKNRELYLDLWPEAKDAEAVFLSIATLFEKMGAPAKMIAHLEEYEKKHAKGDPDKMLSTEQRIAKAYEKAHNQKGAQKIYDRVRDLYEKKMGKAQRAKLGPVAIEVAAKAAFRAVEPEFAEYARIRLPKDEKKVKGVLEQKQKALVELQNRYKGVITMKAAEPAICSFYKIGLAYRNFADELSGAPAPEMPFPKQLNQIKHLWNVPWARWPKDYKEAIPEQDLENIKQQVAAAKEQFQQAYRDQIQQLIVPLEEKATDAFATSVGEGRKLGVYNDCASKSLALLSDKYKPADFPKVTELLADVKAGAEPAQGVGLLAAIQPVPVPAREKTAAPRLEAPVRQAAPAPDEPPGDVPPPREREPDRRPNPPGSKDLEPQGREPDDSDLLKN